VSGREAEPARVGVVGCGIIAKRYVEDSIAFDTWRPVACADLDPAVADAFAKTHALRPASVEELVADPDVDFLLNLTPPTAHAPLIRAALQAGKHVYTEKPLATSVAEGRKLVAEAERVGLRLGCAPDTFLGSAYETGRKLIEAGEIGEPLGAAATMLVGGPDSWHPNADMFYRAGGGPLLDIAPYYLAAIVALLGPIASVAGFAGTPTPERTLGTGPRAGSTVAVEVPTHAASVLRLETGALATLTVSFEARGQYVSGLQIFGTKAMLLLPDANDFGGEVSLRRGTDDPEPVSYESRGAQEVRGIGLHELVEAMRAGRPHRASGELALHVLAAAEAVAQAAGEQRVIELASPALVARA
jgi:predicted dehydrogenase